DKFNTMPKYVVSSTLESPEWTNTTVLKGDVADEVAKLKEQQDGDIVVHGSVQLVQTLLENDVVDDLRLMVFPVVLGSGKRLFGDTSDKKPLQLVDSKVVGDGVAILVYRPAAVTPCTVQLRRSRRSRRRRCTSGRPHRRAFRRRRSGTPRGSVARRASTRGSRPGRPRSAPAPSAS